eukprot:SAG31_NODE_34365_length_333_cov_3.649573_1_plen_41_part_10
MVPALNEWIHWQHSHVRCRRVRARREVRTVVPRIQHAVTDN